MECVATIQSVQSPNMTVKLQQGLTAFDLVLPFLPSMEGEVATALRDGIPVAIDLTYAALPDSPCRVLIATAIRDIHFNAHYAVAFIENFLRRNV